MLSYSKIYYYSLFFTILLTVLAWYLNARWVPVWGVNGAAFATLVAYMVHYVLLLILIRWRIGTSPLCGKQLLVLLIVVALFGLDWLWTSTMTPWFEGLFSKPVYGLVIDAALKSGFFLVTGMVTVYKLKVSESVNHVLDKGWNLIRGK